MLRAPRIRTLAAVLAASTLVAALALPTPATARVAGAAPSCPAPEGNARFVRFIYLEILNRCPDAGGATYWTGRLDAGLSPARFAEIVDMSDENLVDNNVVQLYSILLDRPPTADELSAGLSSLRSYRGNARLTAAIVASKEGYQHLTEDASPTTPAEQDAAWLEVAYNRILDRPSDPSGRAYYSARFSAGGSTEAERLSVARDLEFSTDNARSWVLASMAEALGRTPDAAGVAFWMDWVTGRGRWRTFTMWTTHLSSPEAYRRSQTQPG